MELKIKDITGAEIEVTDLDAAIDQCKKCSDSPYKMESGHTVGDNYAYMLKQLIPIQQENRRSRWLPGTKMRYEQGKRFTKIDIGYEIGHQNPIILHPCIGIAFPVKNWYRSSMKCSELI